MHSIIFSPTALNARKYWPLRIGDDKGDAKFRVGGSPPAGILPQEVNSFTRYFGTFPISGGEEEELSIFTSFNWSDASDPSSLTKNVNKILGQEENVIQCVFHTSSVRSSSSNLSSGLQSYSIIVDNAKTCPAGASVQVPHMIGGTPFFYPKFEGVVAELNILGYSHILQWSGSVRNWDCKIMGEWAFPNYRLNLFLKVENGSYSYKSLLT